MSTQAPHQCLYRRQAGVLLHITSLPGSGACGDLGSEAYRFVDFLQHAGFSVWQTLPVGPTQADGSPYQTSSSHAGSPRLIALEPLVEKGWLDAAVLGRTPVSDAHKRMALQAAFEGFERRADPREQHEFHQFVAAHSYWLQDYALFRALHDEANQAGWTCWPAGLRDRQPQALAEARARLKDELEYIRFEQYLFFSQWHRLKRYANERGVRLFGDMPIFVAHDSAEVWAHRENFRLDGDGNPLVVAGVPPDYFSATGQRWGNPLYNWERLEHDRFVFWEHRLKTQLSLFDLIRIDHFRGFEAYWEIPAQDEVAINGQWIPAPGNALFQHLHSIYDPLPVIAEDLGVITPEVEALRDKYGLPGMKILHFAFEGGAGNPYLPFNHVRNCVVYTGTHDNDTTLGWYQGSSESLRAHVDEFLGHSSEAMPWPLIRCALDSVAALAVIPMQDLLGLDGAHRMNLPGTTVGNWQWRFSWSQVKEDLAYRLRHLNEIYGRIN